MNLTVTGRHVQVSDRLKEYADKKISRLEKFFNQIIDIQMIVLEEKNEKKVELIIHADGAKFYASDQGEDYFACIDALLDKLDQQVKKYKEKLQDRKGRERSFVPIIDLDSEGYENITLVEGTKKPLDLKEAYLEMKMDNSDYLLFRNDIRSDISGIGYSLLYTTDGTYYVVSADDENVDKNNIASNFSFYTMKIIEDSDTDPQIKLEKHDGMLSSQNVSQALQTFDGNADDLYVFYNTEIQSLGLIKKNGNGIELAMPAR